MDVTYEQILQRAEERKRQYRALSLDLFPSKTITFEIGCGHGHFLTSYARANPEKTYVGIDICNQRILRAQKKQNRANLANLHFIKADAAEFLEALPENILINEIFILFPDPWPKTRHYKNRLIQDTFLSLLSNRSLVSSKLCFRTDNDGYFNWAINKLTKHPCWQLDDNLLWPFEEETIFQKKMQNYQSMIALKV